MGMRRVRGHTVGGRAASGVVLYLLLCLLPLVVACVGPLPPGRGFWVEFGVAIGFVGAGMMGVQFVLTARFPAFSMSMGQDTLLRFHRVAGMLAAGFTLGHPVVLIAADPGYASFFDPRVNLPRAGALTSVTLAIIGLIALSVLRPRLAIRYEWWRLSHGLLAAFIMLVAAAHVVMVDHYSEPLAKKAALVAVIGAPVLMFVHMRVVRPWRLWRRPWRVVSMEREIDRVWTVRLEPVGHAGVRFRAGQFAWVTFADSAFALRQHPFTIASDAGRPGSLSFTIKQLGDFTNQIGLIAPGSTAFVEGPAGNFVIPAGAERVVFVAGGIGITPAMAIIRTAVAAGTSRPFRLIYATRTLGNAPFRDELERLAAAHAWLTVHHVLEESPEGLGLGVVEASGFVDEAVLRKLVSAEEFRAGVFMICGPVPMMDGVEGALLDMGVDRARVRSERFDMG